MSPYPRRNIPCRRHRSLPPRRTALPCHAFFEGHARPGADDGGKGGAGSSPPTPNSLRTLGARCYLKQYIYSICMGSVSRFWNLFFIGGICILVNMMWNGNYWITQTTYILSSIHHGLSRKYVGKAFQLSTCVIHRGQRWVASTLLTSVCLPFPLSLSLSLSLSPSPSQANSTSNRR